jgi:hypothetical protein
MIWSYQTWNDAIASDFFRPEIAGGRVHLYVTKELIAKLGYDRGGGLPDFIKAVKTGPVGVTGKGICQKALQCLDYWKYQRGRRGYPLYIGYLALFVLAAGIEGDFSSNEYYRRLRTLLDEEPKPGQYPHFNQMKVLWDDLEHWANEDKSGEWGIFNINIAGSWVHVGRPIAQTLLTQEELKALPVIFAQADLDPTSRPSEAAIAQSIAKYGRKHLRNRTLHLLEETSAHDELRQALVERIIDELCDWDRTAELLCDEETQVYGHLRLCCKLDETAGRATMTLRCSTKHEFPEDGLFLVIDSNPDSFYCDEYSMGWSEPIKAKSDDKNLDASKFDWCQGLRMQSPDSRWHFKLAESSVRVFIKGEGEGLPGLIEVRQLPKGSPFYLAVHEKSSADIEKWGASCCQGFDKLSIKEGLPQGWHFFKAAAANRDDLVKREYPILALPTTVQLDLRGGIRLDRGNRFFKFAPPKLVLRGCDESVKVYCNEQLLDCTQAEGIYELPTDTSTETKLEIEGRQGEDVLRRCSLFLVEDFCLPDSISTQQFDRFGYCQTDVDNKSAGIAGALVRGVNSPPFNFNTLLPVQGKQRIFFVGREPGQVVSYPSEPLPTDWIPIWAIALGRRYGQAMFCGTNLVESEPMQSRCRDRKKLRQWKEILWHRRKRILLSLGDCRLQALWRKFQKEAEHVKG